MVRRRVENTHVLNVTDNRIRKKYPQRQACDRLTACHHLTTTFLQHIDLNTSPDYPRLVYNRFFPIVTCQ